MTDFTIGLLIGIFMLIIFRWYYIAIIKKIQAEIMARDMVICDKCNKETFYCRDCIFNYKEKNSGL